MTRSTIPCLVNLKKMSPKNKIIISDSKKHYQRLLSANDQSVKKILSAVEDKLHLQPNCHLLVHTYRAKGKQQQDPGDDRYN